MSKENLELVLEANAKAKKDISENVLPRLAKGREGLCLEDENKVLSEEIEVLRKQVEYLSKENSGWFQEYQDNLEELEELFVKRKVYIEGYYKDLALELEELRIREGVMEEQILKMQREGKENQGGFLRILSEGTNEEMRRSSGLEYFGMSLVVALCFCLILF